MNTTAKGHTVLTREQQEELEQHTRPYCLNTGKTVRPRPPMQTKTYATQVVPTHYVPTAANAAVLDGSWDPMTGKAGGSVIYLDTNNQQYI